MNKYFKRSQELKDQIIEDRRYLHSIPEIGLDLPKTKEYVTKRLKEIGLEVTEVGHGLSVIIQGKESGPVTLLRADMDALPMTEENDLEFKSTNGCAHTCGHDLHTAMLITGAQIINEFKDELTGTVKLMFQPAEEDMLGSKDMIEAGILENPKVDRAFAIHTGLDDTIGSFGYYKGFMATSNDLFEINIQGKGSHGAYPHQGITPIFTMAMLREGFTEMLAQEIDPREHATITFGEFAGGNSFNIIPDTASIKGTVRTYNPEIRDQIKNRMVEMVEASEKFCRSKVELKFVAGTSPLKNDEELTQNIVDLLKEANPELKAFETKIMASEDLAEVSVKVPTCYIMLSCKVDGNDLPHHNPGVLFDENALPIGAGIFATVGLDLK